MDEIVEEEMYALNSHNRLFLKLEEVNNNIRELRKTLTVEALA